MQNNKGKRFEEEVARLYEALGFIVKRDRLISGQQVDIVAERYLPGIGLTKLLIECKFVAQGSVSNQNVQDFLSMFNAIGPQNGFSNGVLVTNGSFSRNARASKISGAAHLRTTAELETEAINLSDAAYAYVTEYESADLFSYYINLGAEGALPARKPRPSTPSRARSPDPSKDVEKAILHWIRHDRSGFLTLLADFGAGKTTLLEHVKYELCKDILTQTPNAPPIPIFFPLRDLSKFLRLDDYVLNVLAREFRQPVPITIFWKFLEAGSLVLLLDGFDEIAAFANKDDRREAFHIISPLIARNTGPSLMTCRPSFFVSAAEYQDLLNDLLSEERKVLPESVSEPMS
jgi:hypothetical protein